MTEEYSSTGLTNVQKSFGEKDRVARSKSMFGTQGFFTHNFIDMLRECYPVTIRHADISN